MAEGRRFYIFDPPPRPSWRERFAHAVRAVTAHPASALFFAASIAVYCVLLSANLDLAVMIPVVLLGWALGTVGWCFAPGLSWLKKGAWILATAMIFAGTATYIYWHYHPRDWPFNRGGTAPPSAAANPLNQTIQLRCDDGIIPQTVPENGYYEMVIQESAGPHGLFIGTGSSRIPGQDNPYLWKVPSNVEKCRLQNFRTFPVVNVQSELRLRAYEDGKLVITSIDPTPRINLGAAGDESAAFDFYVRNMSTKATVVVTLPTWTKVQAVGSSIWKTATLIPPPENGFTLFPAEPAPPAPIKSPPHRHKSIAAPPANPATTQPSAQAQPVPDPDTIYQHGRGVGSVLGASVVREISTATFDMIYNDCEFDASAAFEFHNLTMTLVNPGPMLAGAMVTPGLGMVTCVREKQVAHID